MLRNGRDSAVAQSLNMVFVLSVLKSELAIPMHCGERREMVGR